MAARVSVSSVRGNQGGAECTARCLLGCDGLYCIESVHPVATTARPGREPLFTCLLSYSTSIKGSPLTLRGVRSGPQPRQHGVREAKGLHRPWPSGRAGRAAHQRRRDAKAAAAEAPPSRLQRYAPCAAADPRARLHAAAALRAQPRGAHLTRACTVQSGLEACAAREVTRARNSRALRACPV